jgi:hypothetical protein
MIKYYFTLLILTSFMGFNNCKDARTRTTKEYYVISEHNGFKSVPSTFTKVNDDEPAPPPPPPPPPPFLKWYTNVVIIFDSIDKVYIYQTKMIKISDPDSLFKKGDFFVPEYPYFVGLKPEQLLCIKSNNFVDFIKDNNEIFKFDTLQYNFRRVFLAASTTDTIKNSAFYKLVELIKTKIAGHQKVLFITRLTTEEENYVINCKRKKIEFKPEQQNWKGKYLDGKCEPYTKEYKLFEKRCSSVRKAVNTFDPECTKLPMIL